MTEQTGKPPLSQQQGAARKLLDRDPPPSYLSEWTAHVAAEKTSVPQGTKSVVIFRIEMEFLALSTDLLQEIIDHYTIRTLPGCASRCVRGLINVRGELLLCIALEGVLGMERAGAGSPTDRLLISPRPIRGSGKRSFGVYRYHPSELRLSPATLRKAEAGSYTIGILPWQGKSVACLDETLLLYAIDKGLT